MINKSEGHRKVPLQIVSSCKARANMALNVMVDRGSTTPYLDHFMLLTGNKLPES